MKHLVLALAIILTCASFADASGFVTGQTSITTVTPVKVGSVAGFRGALTIKNMDATNPVYCGTSTVSSSTGLQISANEKFTVDFSEPAWLSQPPANFDVYCVATGSSVNISWWADFR